MESVTDVSVFSNGLRINCIRETQKIVTKSALSTVKAFRREKYPDKVQDFNEKIFQKKNCTA